MVLTYLHFRILNFPLNYWVTHAFAVPEKLQGNRPSASMNTEGSSCSDHSCGVLQPSLWILSLVPLNWENLQGTREPMENPYIYIYPIYKYKYINILYTYYKYIYIYIYRLYIYVFYMFHGKHNRNKKTWVSCILVSLNRPIDGRQSYLVGGFNPSEKY